MKRLVRATRHDKREFRRIKNWFRRQQWCIRRAMAWGKWTGSVPDTITLEDWQDLLLAMPGGRGAGEPLSRLNRRYRNANKTAWARFLADLGSFRSWQASEQKRSASAGQKGENR